MMSVWVPYYHSQFSVGPFLSLHPNRPASAVELAAMTHHAHWEIFKPFRQIRLFRDGVKGASQNIEIKETDRHTKNPSSEIKEGF